MASLNMDGPFVLIPDKIDEAVPPVRPGNFALGYIADKDFIVLYVGRADENLNAVLKDWVFRRADCLFFKFSLASNAQEAFERECINFHDFGSTTDLKNEHHPQPPENSGWHCPYCPNV